MRLLRVLCQAGRHICETLSSQQVLSATLQFVAYIDQEDDDSDSDYAITTTTATTVGLSHAAVQQTKEALAVESLMLWRVTLAYGLQANVFVELMNLSLLPFLRRRAAALAKPAAATAGSTPLPHQQQQRANRVGAWVLLVCEAATHIAARQRDLQTLVEWSHLSPVCDLAQDCLNAALQRETAGTAAEGGFLAAAWDFLASYYHYAPYQGPQAAIEVVRVQRFAERTLLPLLAHPLTAVLLARAMKETHLEPGAVTDPAGVCERAAQPNLPAISGPPTTGVAQLEGEAVPGVAVWVRLLALVRLVLAVLRAHKGLGESVAAAVAVPFRAVLGLLAVGPEVQRGLWGVPWSARAIASHRSVWLRGESRWTKRTNSIAIAIWR